MFVEGERFGLELKGRSLKTSIAGDVHEILTKVWEPGYVEGDQ